MALRESRVLADLDGTCYGGRAVEVRTPWFRVQSDDNGPAEYVGHELAPLLDLSEAGFYDRGYGSTTSRSSTHGIFRPSAKRFSGT